MVFVVVYKTICVRFGALRAAKPAVKSNIITLQAGTYCVSGLLQQPQEQGKAKGPAACNSQAAGPFSRLNNFCLTFGGHFIMACLFSVCFCELNYTLSKCVLDAFISFRICKIAETENASKFGVRNLGSYPLVRLRRAGAESLKKQRKVITNNNITMSNL